MDDPRQQLDRFMAWFKAQHSPASTKRYQRELERFIEWCNERKHDPGEIPVPDVQDFVLRTDRPGISAPSPATIRNRLSILSTFYDWLIEIHNMNIRNPASVLARHFRFSRQQPGPALSIDDLSQLLDAYDRAWSRHDTMFPLLKARDMAIMHLMIATGLRRAEVASLDVRSFDWDAGEVMVTGKGGKRRSLPLSDALKSDLYAYLDQVRPAFPSPRRDCAEAMFLTAQEAKGDSVRITPDEITYRIRKVLRRLLGPRPNLGPHALRRTFATAMLRDTGNIRLVQMALGHADISTTQRYTALMPGDEADAVRMTGEMLGQAVFGRNG